MPNLRIVPKNPSKEPPTSPSICLGATLYRYEVDHPTNLWNELKIESITPTHVIARTLRGRNAVKLPGVATLEKRSIRMHLGIVFQDEKAEVEWFSEMASPYSDWIYDLRASYATKVLLLLILHQTPLEKVPPSVTPLVLRKMRKLRAQLKRSTDA